MVPVPVVSIFRVRKSPDLWKRYSAYFPAIRLANGYPNHLWKFIGSFHP